MRPLAPILIACLALAPPAAAQTTDLPPVQKVSNYLPHMTRPEVEDLLTRSDLVIIPVASLEQHGTHLPIGTDYLNGVERAKRIAQRSDVLVEPILLPGQSPYHMGFAGTVTLPSTLIQEVYVESVKSLIRHGFKRFLILNAHGGNRAITTFIVDRINQETAGIAVDLGALALFLAEGLKDESTGKGTSSAEMSSTGVWGVRDPAEGTAERGRAMTESFVGAAVAFIERWNELRPVGATTTVPGRGS